jgi:hypothetical protein
MAPAPVLELATLPQRHPRVGEALLDLFGAQAVLRMSIDPVRLPRGVLQRDITVDRKGPSTGGEQATEVLKIGWGGLDSLSEDYCVRVSRTVSAHQITEHAAIAVMALLIHELEGLSICTVLPIGSGGDYLIRRGEEGLGQVEVSGVREDASGREAASRLAKKCEQVLSISRWGYASVTTFRRPPADDLHSYLHYVKKGDGRKPRAKRKRGRK